MDLKDFRKSSYSTSNGGACVETASNGRIVGVRDVKEAPMGDARTVLQFSPEAWADFTASL